MASDSLRMGTIGSSCPKSFSMAACVFWKTNKSVTSRSNFCCKNSSRREGSSRPCRQRMVSFRHDPNNSRVDQTYPSSIGNDVAVDLCISLCDKLRQVLNELGVLIQF